METWLKIKLSSAKNKCETFRPSLQIETPLIEPTCSACCISECKPFAHKRNRYGDRGSPWRSHLLGEKWQWGSPFTNTEYETNRMQELIREIHLSAKPNFTISFSKKTHSTLSYALLISSLRAINPNFPFLLFFRWWSVSNATRMLSEINLSDMKALWVFDTSLGSSFFRRFAMVLEIIL